MKSEVRETEVRAFLAKLEEIATTFSSNGNQRVFRSQVRNYFKKYGRKFPWRETNDPYKILVSELMLQQTQTDRVIPKYLSFVSALPTVKHLSEASTQEVLKLWSGLGYYRRALNLKRAATEIIDNFGGEFPTSFEDLMTLPGIGPYSAGAICNFAFQNPYPIIETNIRTVFLHLYFPSEENVHDKRILELVDTTMDRKNPRDWFYALMDLGAAFKRTRPKINHRSRHRAIQSKFKGSHREKRAAIIRMLHDLASISVSDTSRSLAIEPEYADNLLEELYKEGFLQKTRNKYRLSHD